MPPQRTLATTFIVVAVLAAGCAGLVPSETEQQSTSTETMTTPLETTSTTAEMTESETTDEVTRVEETTRLYHGEPVLSVENVSDDELPRFDSEQITTFKNLTEEQQSVFLQAYRNGSAEFDDEFDFTNGTWVVKYEGRYYEVVAENA